MSDTCTHDCSSCTANCASREGGEAAPAKDAGNVNSHIRKVIGVVSGKGGVGKSLVTSLLAVTSARRGYKTAIMDADITGPSIPKAFGLHSQAAATEQGLLPVVSKTGISTMFINRLLQNETDPVVCRGPIVAGVLRQFWNDVVWGDVDYMFVDMPPGTGDVPLTVFQSLPVDGIIIVTTPQDLVSMIVSKAVRMAEMMNVPVLGVVENMSYYTCPDCGKQHEIFGASKVQDVAAAFDIPHTARIPIDPVITTMVDAGEIEHVNAEFLTELVDNLEKDLPLEET
jgi:Mrp family chromosome partitioning ATPase